MELIELIIQIIKIIAIAIAGYFLIRIERKLSMLSSQKLQPAHPSLAGSSSKNIEAEADKLKKTLLFLIYFGILFLLISFILDLTVSFTVFKHNQYAFIKYEANRDLVYLFTDRKVTPYLLFGFFFLPMILAIGTVISFNQFLKREGKAKMFWWGLFVMLLILLYQRASAHLLGAFSWLH